MRILCGFPDPLGWTAAARFLGHAAAPLDYDRAVLQFDRERPDAALVDSRFLSPRGRTPIGVALATHPDTKFVLLYRPGQEINLPRAQDALASLDRQDGMYHLRPATTFLPDFPGGTARDEFRCDLLVTADPTPEREAHVARWAGEGRRVKIFSSAKWPFPEYLGRLSGRDRIDAFASATQWVNFADEWAALDVMACGGTVAFPECAGWNMLLRGGRQDVLKDDTLVNRLSDILGLLQ